MSLINLTQIAEELPSAWASTVLSQLGSTRFKVLRMDELAYPNEEHSFAEVLLVIEGQLNLVVADQLTVVRSGEAFVVPPNTPHFVTKGSKGTLVILDN